MPPKDIKTFGPTELVELRWPYDGPRSHEQTADAAAALIDLTRYLANATQYRSAMPYPQTGYVALGAVCGVAAMADQVLRQVAAALVEMSGDPGVYDDRHSAEHPPGQTAAATQLAIDDARVHLADAVAALRDAAKLAVHLGGEPEQAGVTR